MNQIAIHPLSVIEALTSKKYWSFHIYSAFIIGRQPTIFKSGNLSSRSIFHPSSPGSVPYQPPVISSPLLGNTALTITLRLSAGKSSFGSRQRMNSSRSSRAPCIYDNAIRSRNKLLSGWLKSSTTSFAIRIALTPNVFISITRLSVWPYGRQYHTADGISGI